MKNTIKMHTVLNSSEYSIFLIHYSSLVSIETILDPDRLKTNKALAVDAWETLLNTFGTEAVHSAIKHIGVSLNTINQRIYDENEMQKQETKLKYVKTSDNLKREKPKSQPESEKEVN